MILAWVALVPGGRAVAARRCAICACCARPAPAAGRPAVSVLIPARNEEANIADACAAVLANEGVELELVVLDDASTDRTPDDPARRSPTPGCAWPRRRALPPGWSGKQHACHVLAGLARHELMVFVDADVRLAPDALCAHGRVHAAQQGRPGQRLSGADHADLVGACCCCR